MKTASTPSTGHGTVRVRVRVRLRRAGAAAVVGLLSLGACSAMVAVAQSPPGAAPPGPGAGPPVAPAATLPEPRPLSATEAPRYLRQLARQLRAATEGSPVELSTTSREVLRLRIAAADLFDLDAAQLRTEGPSRLDPLVAALVKSDRTVLVVVGHTDTLGTREFNAAWSLRRATAVADYLQAKGIAASRLSVRGAGELELRERQEDTPEARERNRRIEIEVRPARPSRRAAS
jgi:outer membrane protein OmpA-like peptidoglycan-associated protein